MAMLLATAEITGEEADYVEVLSVLREHCDYDALQRMVRVARAE
ncbi:hypothetical protein XA26_42930 [Mycolicibacterium fortuitum]|uniref:Uncharacterized protein n=1 Tax=Mycolicibacterium fortuitum TaxID=1766 RepID=A0A0N9XVS6_MYCFO|nr:hypothetical protein XA26_42930 [Mycolicibacterium fortuitum]